MKPDTHILKTKWNTFHFSSDPLYPNGEWMNVWSAAPVPVELPEQVLNEMDQYCPMLVRTMFGDSEIRRAFFVCRQPTAVKVEHARELWIALVSMNHV